jgi:hypothetical protein
LGKNSYYSKKLFISFLILKQLKQLQQQELLHNYQNKFFLRIGTINNLISIEKKMNGFKKILIILLLF